MNLQIGHTYIIGLINGNDSFAVIMEIVIIRLNLSMYKDSFEKGFRWSKTYDMKETDFVF